MNTKLIGYASVFYVHLRSIKIMNNHRPCIRIDMTQRRRTTDPPSINIFCGLVMSQMGKKIAIETLTREFRTFFFEMEGKFERRTEYTIKKKKSISRNVSFSTQIFKNLGIFLFSFRNPYNFQPQSNSITLIF